MELTLDAPIQSIPSIGKRIAKTLSQRNINTVGDLLYFFPRKYLDRSRIVKIGEIQAGQEITCLGVVRSVETRKAGKLKITQAILYDGTGYLFLIWFGERKIEKIIDRDSKISVSGKVTYYKGRLQIENPEFEVIEDESTLNLLNTGKIVPVYPSISNVSQKFLRKLVLNALEKTYISEILPAEVVINEELLPRHNAFYEVHFPENNQLLERALYRFRFEEIFILQTALAHLKFNYQKPDAGIAHSGSKELVDKFISSLGVLLTESQRQAIDEIISDLKNSKPMNRLLQGEVGSGKTIVALSAALFVASGGFQVAFMAPTEILAQQQFDKYAPFLENIGIKCALLTSSTKGRQRQTILEGIRNGHIKIVFGTHSLIYDEVKFKRLGFVIIDEQHRFGTMQRLMLREKGKNPDLLIVSATPIPRTLALTVFGDLDITSLKERPTGYDLKTQVKTVHLNTDKRHIAYEHLRKEIENGKKGFIVVPLVEESEKLEAKSVKDALDFVLNYVDKELIRVIHGKQTSLEKIEAIEAFRNGTARVLVSTTVVEVGVDVPDATVMIIENAERFGLSQLHQLRGRVGRGKDKAVVYAISDLPTEESALRIDAFVNNFDGFKLAEEDLRLRGEGDIFGYRQSGPSGLKFAQYARDLELLEKIRGLSFNYYLRFNDNNNSVKMILKEALNRYSNMELALKA
ncbi:MAG: ATP-dependent DNA helicase RecG [Actinobacteria bacterium]|nr:ATP-dependent DNA helicase RecG [Actinomycetota bacterium]